MASYLEAYVGCSEKESNINKWAIEKPKLDNAGQMRGIFFIEPDDEVFRHIIENARRMLEVPMPAVVLGKARPNMLVLLMPPKKVSENIHLNPGSLRQRGRTR